MSDRTHPSIRPGVPPAADAQKLPPVQNPQSPQGTPSRHSQPRPAGPAPATTTQHIIVHTPPPAVFKPPRSRWPGLVGAGLLAAVATALIVSGQYDDRSVGQRLDASLAAAGAGVDGQVQGLKDGLKDGATTVAATVQDAAITASVKAALATDPALSALAIEVETHDGVVQLRGPAPDDTARDRAGMLAAAPAGVRSVNNELKLPSDLPSDLPSGLPALPPATTGEG